MNPILIYIQKHVTYTMHTHTVMSVTLIRNGRVKILLFNALYMIKIFKCILPRFNKNNFCMNMTILCPEKNQDTSRKKKRTHNPRQ